MATNETHTHCYQPLVRKCDGEPSSKEGGKEVCKDWPETFCTTQYKQNDGGQFVADTKCERIHTELCVPENCVMVPGPEKCHEQVVPSIHEVPEEVSLKKLNRCLKYSNLYVANQDFYLLLVSFN